MKTYHIIAIQSDIQVILLFKPYILKQQKVE